MRVRAHARKRVSRRAEPARKKVNRRAMSDSSTSAIRRIVTGHDAGGKAIVLSDGPAPNVRKRPQTGIVATLLWTTDSAPATFTNGDRGNVQIATTPAKHGTILRVVEFPPGPVESDPAAAAHALSEMGLKPSANVRRPIRHAHMHATESVDYAIVIEGEIDMLLDDTEVHMKTGDIMVQQGTNHAWVNNGDKPCKIAFVLVDADGSPIITND